MRVHAFLTDAHDIARSVQIENLIFEIEFEGNPSRGLNCLIAIDAKVVEFVPEHLVKLQFY